MNGRPTSMTVTVTVTVTVMGRDKTCGYARVHAGWRGYTRVHAGTRVYVYVGEMDKIRHRRRRGFGRVDDRTRGFARVHARTFPNAYFDKLNAQMDRGSPYYDGYNMPKTALDCDVYRQSQPMSRAKTETETSESEKMFAQRPSAPMHVTSLNPSQIALTYCVTVAYCTEATKKAKHHQTGLNLFIRHLVQTCVHF